MMAFKHAETAPALAVDAASSWPGGPGGPGLTELRRRIWFTLGALVVYRVGTHVPIPGLNPVMLQEFYRWGYGDVYIAFPGGDPWPSFGDILHIINGFSGDALQRMSIFALSVMPYVSALIIMHLATVVWPAIGRWKTEGRSGRRRFSQYVWYGTMVLAAFQAYGMAVGLEGIIVLFSPPMVIDPGLFFRASTVITVVSGTMFLVWLGEQITARGVGNGIVLIIFVGLMANLPAALVGAFELTLTGALPPLPATMASIIAIGATVLIVFMERARRRIIVQNPSRQNRRPTSGRDITHLPLKLNAAGIIPPIFASLLLPFPLAMAGSFGDGGPDWLWPVIRQFEYGQPLYLTLYATLIVSISFAFRPETYDPAAVARHLERSGKVVSGLRPGRNTEDYLRHVQTRLTVIGAAYLVAVCVLPEALFPWIAWTFPLGVASLVIIVLVTQELATEIYRHVLPGRS